MGTAKKAPKATAGFGVPAGSPAPRGGASSSRFSRSSAALPEEPGLVVRWKKGSGAIFTAILCFCVLLLSGTLLVSPSLPRLLSHWSWCVLTLFSLPIVICHCTTVLTIYEETHRKAEAMAASLIYWGLFMVHGLLWMSLLLVPLFGVPPGVLWDAFGEHGGHLHLAQFGSVPLLTIPPLLLLAYVWFDRQYLVLVYHDVFEATNARLGNSVWQLLSPLIPLSVWAAFLRTPLFTDLPRWPGVVPLLAVCALANGPLLLYVFWSTRHFYGPAHWLLDGGVAVWYCPPAKEMHRPKGKAT
jgi:hypothetical protein